jgi:hypothetical protein
MYFKLKSLRQECGGCPTSYSGETKEGYYFEAYLRNGYMKVEINGRKIVSENPRGLDGVCSFDDFKMYARMNGHIIDDSEAEWSSQIEDTEKAILEAFKDIVWVKFTRDFQASDGKLFETGKRYTAKINVADILVEAKLAVIDDSSYERKKEEWLKEKLLSKRT